MLAALTCCPSGMASPVEAEALSYCAQHTQEPSLADVHQPLPFPFSSKGNVSHDYRNTVLVLPWMWQEAGAERTNTGWKAHGDTSHHAGPASAHRCSMALIDQQHVFGSSVLLFMSLRKDAQDEY